MKKLLLFLVISIASISFADEKINSDSAIDNWSLISDSRLITRGETVWGHQFGFMKDLRACDSDILLISWSTDISEGKLKEFEGKDAYIHLNIDGELLEEELEFTLMFAGPLDSMEIGYFGAIVKSESFIEKLKQSSRIELTFLKPANLLNILDIKTDYFNTEGLNKSYSLLDNSCPI